MDVYVQHLQGPKPKKNTLLTNPHFLRGQQGAMAIDCPLGSIVSLASFWILLHVAMVTKFCGIFWVILHVHYLFVLIELLGFLRVFVKEMLSTVKIV